jgi:hypothetical protein
LVVQFMQAWAHCGCTNRFCEQLEQARTPSSLLCLDTQALHLVLLLTPGAEHKAQPSACSGLLLACTQLVHACCLLAGRVW